MTDPKPDPRDWRTSHAAAILLIQDVQALLVDVEHVGCAPDCDRQRLLAMMGE